MKIIITDLFNKQIINLSRKYKNIFNDLELFKSNLNIEPFSDLGQGIYKYRFGNSSIPVGKRSGFRIIIFKDNNNYIPIIIYAKTIQENISKDNIKKALIEVIKEIKTIKNNI